MPRFSSRLHLWLRTPRCAAKFPGRRTCCEMIECPLILRTRNVAGVISTDDIIPARYKHSFVDPADMAKHVFENLLPGFAATLRTGDVILGSDTFGVGSSREQAVSSLLASGVKAVIAPRFGRIFFRNAWNLGLIAIEI